MVERTEGRMNLYVFGKYDLDIMQIGSEEFVKKVYMSESEGPNSRGRSPGRWRDRVKEYMCERGATRGGGLDQQGGSVWTGRGGDFSAVATPLGDVLRGREAFRAKDR